MKTKIIYISGGEIFNMSDIRTAFDEVRAALALDSETVLFGVPVDGDTAFGADAKPHTANVNIENITESVTDSEPEQIKTAEPIIDMPVEKPKKSSRQSRAKIIPITTPVEPIVDINDEPDQPVTKSDTNSTIPILSVLGANTDAEAVAAEPEPDNVSETVTDTTTVENDDIQPMTQTVTIGDMLNDDTAPVDAHEKTLEELLESMTPLGEDEKLVVQPTPEPTIEPVTNIAESNDSDTDATLELLAAEFAETEDKIVAPTKTETRGKIGKLKNILPFKKAKRDDSGIMGDLFGWAGVANDEDFTIPGFFANATSKK